MSRSNVSDLETPDHGETNTSRGGWNGGSQGWLMKKSLLVSSSLLQQNYFRVELYVGATKIASGEFSMRSDLFAPDKLKK